MSDFVRAIEHFDVSEALKAVALHGAVSIPLLSNKERVPLVAQAYDATYEPQPLYLPSGVREELTACPDLPPESPCSIFAHTLQRHLNNSVSGFAHPPFSRPLIFEEIVIQRYEVGSGGITPHRDFKQSIDLICVLAIDGVGRLCLCDDRAGSNPRELRTHPGDLVLMRGPGFMGSDHRPFHFLDRIITQRFTLGMRCVKEEE